MAINISSLFLALKYIKYCCLDHNPKNTSRLDLRFSNYHNGLEVKQQYQ